MEIGNVISIGYNQLKVRISSEIRGGSINVRGTVYYFGNIGCYLKTSNALGESIICEVISISDDDAYTETDSYNSESNRELSLKPLGTITHNKNFALGVGIFPSIYSSVHIVTNEDMETILGIKESYESENKQKNDVGGIIHDSFNIGISKNLINYPIQINIDNFFNIHSAVLGNSGSGKSNTIAHIIQQIHRKKNYSAIGSKIIIFDVNGEYKQAFEEKGSNQNLTIKYYKPNIKEEDIEENKDGTELFFMPYFLLNLEEWSAFLIATDATQKPFWDKVLKESSHIYAIYSSESENGGILANYLLYRLCGMIDDVLRRVIDETSACGSARSIINSINNMVNKDPFLQGIREEELFASMEIHFLEATSYGKESRVDTKQVEKQNFDKIIEHLLNATQLTFGKNKNTLIDTVIEIQKNTKKNIEMFPDERFSYGKYFNHKFLKFAAEILLIEEDSRGNTQIRNWTSTMITRLEYFLENDDCSFMRGPANNEAYKDSEAYLEKFFGIGDKSLLRDQLIIIDTSELSPDVLETLTSVISRLIFDYRKKLKNNDRTSQPIHLILDEAHRYVKKDQEYLLKENIFEKIAREGRKYSFYLMVSSQRPSEISETVLSQCGNFIVHNIQNELDMRYIRAILPYFSDDFTDKIKQSVPGEALIFGKCVPMPLHIKVELANPIPNSENCKIAEEWFDPTPIQSFNTESS